MKTKERSALAVQIIEQMRRNTAALKPPVMVKETTPIVAESFDGPLHMPTTVHRSPMGTRYSNRGGNRAKLRAHLSAAY